MADHMDARRDEDIPRDATARDAGASRLVPLEELPDWKVADDDPDVRGWEVRAGDGGRIGEVTRLIVDPAAERVRYLEVSLEGSDRSTLVPIGLARLNDDTDTVTIASLAGDRFGAMPPYDPARLDRAYETTLLLFVRPEEEWRRRHADDFYDHAAFDDRAFYGSRKW